MGPVFRAYDAERERLVAIKLFKLDLPPDRVHRLVAEFEKLIATDLAHPVIAKPLATGMSGVAAYLVFDYVAAESLDLALRENGPSSAGDAVRIAAQLAGALDFASVVSVHHGALHPRDVLVLADDSRLTGLGVVEALERVGVAPPVRRPYTAPEHAGGATADVFSLAAVMFELLSGRRVAGTGEQAAATLDVAGADAAALRTVFARALAEDPNDRFPTALEFANAFTGAFMASPPLPFDVPELRAASALDVGEVLEDDDLPLVVAVQERFEDVEVVPSVVPAAPPAADANDAEDAEDRQTSNLVPSPSPASPAVAPQEHEPFVALEQSRSAVWPIALALGVGLAVGYAGGYAVGGREKAAPIAAAAPSAGREFTESAVKPQVPERQAPPSAVSAQPSAPPAPRQSAIRNPQSAVSSGPGRLQIRSTPAGAHVSVDGREAGVTPATVRDLAFGSHRVRVARDGYTTEERRIVISRGLPSQSVLVPLAREGAAPTAGARAAVSGLNVDSRPTGARVFLDGKLIGTTPLSVNAVAAGDHAIRLELDGYRRWSSSVRVVANEPNRVTASLER